MQYDIGGFDVPRARVDALIAVGNRFGMTVGEDWNEPEGARFIGTFAGTHVTLYPKFDPHFALFFTVAHLYGHMVQAAIASPAAAAVVKLLGRGGLLTHQEIQLVYDHEREAAAIGRTLIGELGDVTLEEDRQYLRMFLADFHYLINFIETEERGTEVFARFLRREPLPLEIMTPDSRPLVDLRQATVVNSEVVVV